MVSFETSLKKQTHRDIRKPFLRLAGNAIFHKIIKKLESM